MSVDFVLQMFGQALSLVRSEVPRGNRTLRAGWEAGSFCHPVRAAANATDPQCRKAILVILGTMLLTRTPPGYCIQNHDAVQLRAKERHT